MIFSKLETNPQGKFKGWSIKIKLTTYVFSSKSRLINFNKFTNSYNRMVHVAVLPTLRVFLHRSALASREQTGPLPHAS